MIKVGITPDVNALTSIMLLVISATLITITIVQSRSIRKEAL